MKHAIIISLAVVTLFGGSVVAETREQQIEQVKALHKQRPYSKALLESGLLAPDVEWWAVGDRNELPWAGTWRGPEGIASFFQRLNELMEYRKFELVEYIADENSVVAIIDAGGVARSTGKPFASQIIRIYTFDNGKIVRIRNYYDTSKYAASLRPVETP